MAELKLLWQAEISKPKARLIYVSVIVYFKKELNILRMAINVLDIFQLSDVYKIKLYAGSSWVSVTAISARSTKHIPMAKYNFFTG